MMEEKAEIFCQRHVQFKTVSELLEILTLAEADPSRVTHIAPVLPKAGEVYVYTWGQEEKLKDKWRMDHHRWRNNGTKRYPAVSPMFTKFYHVLLTDFGASTAFQRVAYLPLDPSINKVIIHYTGDETLSNPMDRLQSSRTRKSPKIQKAKSLPSGEVVKLPEMVQPIKEGKVTKRKTVLADDGIKPEIKSPKQTRKYSTKNTIKEQFDWIGDLRDLAFELETFVKKVTILPELVCVLGSEEMLLEFDRVLDLDCTYSQLLSYNTIPLPGGYFVSTLMFRHLLFEGSPFMPVAHVLHKKLLNDRGDGLISSIIDEIPRLKSLKDVISVDPKIALGVEKCLPMAKIVYSWNHIKLFAKAWLTRTNETYRTKYMNELVMLLECKSEESYDRQLETLKLTWGSAWAQFFSETLENDIRTRAGRWKLEELRVYSSYTGVTPPISTPFETVMTALATQPSSVVEASTVVLALDQLHSYFITQIRFAQCAKQGLFSVRREFCECIQDLEDVMFPESFISPEKIVPYAVEQIEKGPPFTDALTSSIDCSIHRDMNDYTTTKGFGQTSGPREVQQKGNSDKAPADEEYEISKQEPCAEHQESPLPSDNAETPQCIEETKCLVISDKGSYPVSLTSVGSPANKLVEATVNPKVEAQS